jgi:phosphoadenosine phosphosulfate reductase
MPRVELTRPSPSVAGDTTAADISALLQDAHSLEERLAAVRAAVPGRIVFATSLGLEDQAILHAMATGGLDIEVLTLDTGRHFLETLEMIGQSERRYGVSIRLVAPKADDVEALVARDGVLGFRTSIDSRKACCDARKVRPLRRALAGTAAWITGLRRGQSSGRSDVALASWEQAEQRLKISPLADWPAERVDAYIRANDIPVNPLHARGFPSIGCQPCTRAVRPGEDIRAGRWWWENEDGKECGLHNRPRTPAGAIA